MANPVVVNITEGQWSKAASAVTVGAVLPLKSGPIYLQTIREAGSLSVPIDNDFSDAKEFTFSGALIDSSQSIDVYVTTKRGDGSVRVDL